MVHSHIGTAQITYPVGVKVSPADPMTSANLPLELRMVPGVVSRPVRIGAMAYYPNLGAIDTSSVTAAVASIPTWVWWTVGAGVLALMLGPVVFRGRTRRQPSVRTVTRTTY